MKIPTFQANFILRGKIECLTGLHIGGSKEKLQIGGVDSIVIRNPRNQHPYIPGSSLKGKMRHLLEYVTGGVNMPIHRDIDSKKKTMEEIDGGNLGQVSRKKEIARIFGVGVDDREKYKTIAKEAPHLIQIKEKYEEELKDIGPPRLIVRDAFPDASTVKMWGDLGSDANFTEYKAENTIDRLTSAANPRFIERVVEGSVFDFELVYTAYASDEPTSDEIDAINEDIDLIFAGLRLLENSALGKSGSRGYGNVRFWLDEPRWVHAKSYREGDEAWTATRSTLPDRERLQLVGNLADEYKFNPSRA